MKTKIYCKGKDCPYTDCDKHSNQIKGQKGSFYLKGYDATCKKYISWLAYSDYEKYKELKGGSDE